MRLLNDRRKRVNYLLPPFRLCVLNENSKYRELNVRQAGGPV